jgi:peptidyl-dipeptidase A
MINSTTKLLFATAAMGALLTGCASTPPPAVDTPPPPVADNSTPPPPAGPTPEQAKAYATTTEDKLAEMGEYAARISWVRNTYITFDTEWLESKTNADFTKVLVKSAKDAALYNQTAADVETRRKLELLKLSLTLPASDRAGAAEELSELNTRLDSTFATGKFSYKGKTYTLNEASNLMATSRDPALLKAMWEGRLQAPDRTVERRRA